MSKRILQVNFKLPENMDMDSPEGQQTVKEWVQDAVEFPGLQWKIWLKNEEKGEFGGLHLFEDEESLQKYLEGKTMRQVSEMPEASIKTFEFEEELTRMTNGPVD